MVAALNTSTKLAHGAIHGLIVLLFLFYADLASALTQRMIIPNQTITLTAGGGGGAPPSGTVRAYCLDKNYSPPDSGDSFHGTNMGTAVVRFGNGRQVPLTQAIATGNISVKGSDAGYDRLTFINNTNTRATIQFTTPTVMIPDEPQQTELDIEDVYGQLSSGLSNDNNARPATPEQHDNLQDELWKIREAKSRDNIYNFGIDPQSLNDSEYRVPIHELNKLALYIRQNPSLPGIILWVLNPRSAAGEPAGIVYTAGASAVAKGYGAMQQHLQSEIGSRLQNTPDKLKLTLLGDEYVNDETFDKVFLNMIVGTGVQTLNRFDFGPPNVPPSFAAWNGGAGLPPPLPATASEERKSLTQRYPDANIALRLSADFWRPVLAGMARIRARFTIAPEDVQPEKVEDILERARRLAEEGIRDDDFLRLRTGPLPGNPLIELLPQGRSMKVGDLPANDPKRATRLGSR
jgi:hypothetical protein